MYKLTSRPSSRSVYDAYSLYAHVYFLSLQVLRLYTAHVYTYVARYIFLLMSVTNVDHGNPELTKPENYS